MFDSLVFGLLAQLLVENSVEAKMEQSPKTIALWYQTVEDQLLRQT